MVELSNFPNETSIWMEGRPIKRVTCYEINGKYYPKTDVEIVQ